jgi:hypothetical protein
MVLLNSFSLLALVSLIVGHLEMRNKLKSWSMAFHALLAIWLIFREIFWVLSVVTVWPWSASTFYFIYWLPHPIQFAMLLLIPLFYFKVLTKLGRRFGNSGSECLNSTDESHWRCLRYVYVSCVLAMVVFMGACVVAAGSMEDEQFRCLSYNVSLASPLFLLLI